MIEIHMHEVNVNLVINPETEMRTLRFVDPHSGIAVRLDFPAGAARQLAKVLTQSSLVVAPADAMPREVQH